MSHEERYREQTRAELAPFAGRHLMPRALVHQGEGRNQAPQIPIGTKAVYSTLPANAASTNISFANLLLPPVANNYPLGSYTVTSGRVFYLKRISLQLAAYAIDPLTGSPIFGMLPLTSYKVTVYNNQASEAFNQDIYSLGMGDWLNVSTIIAPNNTVSFALTYDTTNVLQPVNVIALGGFLTMEGDMLTPNDRPPQYTALTES